MLGPDLIDVPVEVFGGYCCALPDAALPSGAASTAQDVAFPMGVVRTRGGLRSVYATNIAAGASINGLKSYITPTLAKRLLAWDSLGNLYKESPEGTINLINSRPYRNLFYESQTLFGREYQAFFDINGGFDIPRQYDDTNWDRVSQVGPGSAPIVSNEVLSYVIAAVGVPGLAMADPVTGVSAASQAGNIVTLTLAGAISAGIGSTLIVTGVGTGYDGTWKVLSSNSGTHVYTYAANQTGLLPLGAGGTVTSTLVRVTTTTTNTFVLGQSVLIAGAGVGGYNGTWKVVAHSGAIAVLDTNQNGLANSGGGTIAAAGNIAAGLHQCSLAFITRQGYITMAAVPPTTFTAIGNLRAIVGDIATGPNNGTIVARLLLFTPVITPPATTGSFYSLPLGSTQIFSSAMLIADNTTTSTVVDFTDAILISGFQANYLFTQLELGECAFNIGYNSRLAWLGERNRQANFNNLSFDGGFALDSVGVNYPRAWTEDPTSYAGGNSALVAGLPADYGDAFVITGDGVTVTRGKISQSAYQDYLGVTIIDKTLSYGVRVRVAKTAGLLQGKVHVNLNCSSLGFTTVGVVVDASAALTTFQEFTATLIAANAGVASDLTLQVYADTTPTNGQSFIIDSIEVYPLNAPYNYSTARFSHAFNPESYDGTTGQVQVRPSDGTQLRAAFPLRDNLYLAKDHYLCYTTDDGVNEPSSWSVNEVSGTIGICGPNAVDWTEEWAVFAERAGLHICWGSDPVKLTPEIQSDASATGKICWQSIAWQYGHTIWVRIDKVNKKILVGAPVNGATTPNMVFALDYQWLDTAEEIANAPQVTYSSYSGKIMGHGRGRRWSLWNITANSMTFAERADGTAQPFFGNGTANAKIYQQFDAPVQAEDDGAAVNGRYEGYGSPTIVEEQQFQLGNHRKLLGYLKWLARGVGNMNIVVSTSRRSKTLRTYALSLNPVQDAGRPIDMHGERFSIEVSTNAVGSWFQLERLTGCLKKDSTMVVTGTAQ